MPRPSPLVLIQKWSALSSLALIATTYPLWFPASTPDAFPQVPLFQLFCSWPIPIDGIASCLLLAGWIVTLLSRSRWGLILVVIFSALLVALNQHRLQPWHFQLTLFALVLLLGPAWKQLQILQWLVISIYIFSALSKADFEFLHTVGQQVLGQIVGVFGYVPSNPASSSYVYAASAIPIVELIVALGLIPTQTRRIAGSAACGMHLGLVLMLGPVGLQHSLGVQIWNLHFAVLSILLFVLPPRSGTPEDPSLSDRRGTSKGTQLVLWAVLCPIFGMPLLERFGWWDHWTSWALYAPHSSRAEILVASTAVARLPAELKAEMPAIEDGQLWVRVPLEKWSLHTLRAPVYPQARFQFAIARSLARRLNSEFEIRVQLLSVASRFDGRRTVVGLEGLTQIESAGRRFLFNTCPRGEVP